MDTQQGTLDMIKRSLDENNELLKWNVCPTKRGRILLRIEYGGQKDPNTNSQNYVSYRRTTQKENERNYHRTKNYKDNILPLKRKRNESTPEISRKCDNSSVSNPPHTSLDTSECIEMNATAHDHSVASIESECFGECLSTHEATCESAPEFEPAKPEEKLHQSPTMPTIPNNANLEIDPKLLDPSATLIRILDQLETKPYEFADDEKSHVCDLESEVMHWGPCGLKQYSCVYSLINYMKWLDYGVKQNPETRISVEQKKAQARVKYKLDEYPDFGPSDT